MGYKLVYQGFEIVCDTPAELKEALQVLIWITGNGKLPYSKTRPAVDQDAQDSVWTEDRFREFTEHLRGPGKLKQRRLLKVLIDNPNGVSDQVLRSEVGARNNNVLAGVITGIVKNAGKVRVPPQGVYRRTQVDVGGITGYKYRLAPSFVEMARQLGWPEKQKAE